MSQLSSVIFQNKCCHKHSATPFKMPDLQVLHLSGLIPSASYKVVKMIGVKSKRLWVKSISMHGSMFQQTVPWRPTQIVFPPGRCPISHHSGYQNALHVPTCCLARQCRFRKQNFQDNVGNVPLNKRGWVVQERVLAPRVIHYCVREICFWGVL
jgi:hypothetical protein